eukprot:529760-Amorphochlora_amoeboformis.AAC.1
MDVLLPYFIPAGCSLSNFLVNDILLGFDDDDWARRVVDKIVADGTDESSTERTHTAAAEDDELGLMLFDVFEDSMFYRHGVRADKEHLHLELVLVP